MSGQVTTEATLNFNWSAFLSNFTLDDIEGFESFMRIPGVKITFITLYVIILTISVAANGLVIFIVTRTKCLQNVRNLFILNLAVGDIAMGTLAAPITPISFYLRSWVLGEFMCSLLPVCMGTFVHISTFTCTAIAVHRYTQIVLPARAQMTKRICFLTSFGIWVISVCISSPLGVYTEVLTFNEYSYCISKWPSGEALQVYTMAELFIQFLIPCAIIIVCYVQVWRSLRLYYGGVASYSQMDHEDVTQAQQTNIMLVVMVIVFVCCWLPMNLLFILFDFCPEVFASVAVDVIFFITHVMAMSSTVWNPIIYAGMDKNFQKEFKKKIFPLLEFIGLKEKQRTLYTAEAEVKEDDMVHYTPYSDNVEIVPNDVQ